jgi:hypothetical protein
MITMVGQRMTILMGEISIHASTDIHLVYVMVPGKGIAMHQRLRGDDDTGEIGIGNELGKNNYG